MSDAKSWFIAAGFLPLWAYIFVVTVPGRTILGLPDRMSAWWISFTIGILLIVWTTRNVGSRWRATRTLSAMALVAFVTLLIIDVTYGFYYRKYVEVETVNLFEYTDGGPLGRVAELNDPVQWQPNFGPDQYFPTEDNFVIYKPSISASSRGYGQAYYPELLKSPLLVESVLTLRDKDYFINADGYKETLDFGDASIFVLGDSFTANVSTTQSAMWHEVLEHNTGVPIYNLGISGHSPHNGLLLFTEMLENGSIDGRIDRLLWMIFEGNDLEGNYGDGHRVDSAEISDDVSSIEAMKDTILGPIFTLPREINSRSIIADILNGDLEFGRQSDDAQTGETSEIDDVRLLFPLYSSEMYGPRLFHEPYVERATKPRSYVDTHPHIGKLGVIIHQMSELAKRYDFEVTIITAPSAPRLYAQYFEDFPQISDLPHFNDYVLEHAEHAGLDTLDLLRLLAPFAESEMLYWRDDTHWDVRGNEVVAELVEAHVFGN